MAQGEARQVKRQLLLALACFAGLTALLYGCPDSYPPCDTPTARQKLAFAQDPAHSRLVASIQALRLVHDRPGARHCLATITWSDGTTTDLPYRWLARRPGFDRTDELRIDFGSARTP